MDETTKMHQEISRMIAMSEDGAVVSVASIRASAPTEKLTRMLVKADGNVIGSIGGGSLETRVITEALKIIKQGKPTRLRIGVSRKEEMERGMEHGGKLKYFIEPIQFLPTLFIFGGGNISLALAQIGKILGFRIVVVDNVEEFANPQRYPEAHLVLAEDYNSAVSKITLGKSSYVVVATRNHKYDELVLEKVLHTEAEYIGMAACSADKKRAIFSRLTAKGMPNQILGKVHAPVGLDINAQTLEEMALSILAEIVKFRRSRLEHDETQGGKK